MPSYSKMLSLLFILFGVAVANVSNNAPPSLYACIDWECEDWISQGVTMLRYSGKTDKHLSFQKNQKIQIISKPVNKDIPDWVGKMGNKIGLVPRDMVREDRVNKNPTKFKLDLQEVLGLDGDTDAGQEEDDELEDDENSNENELDGVEIEDIELDNADDVNPVDKNELPEQKEKTPLEEATPTESVPLQTTEALPPPPPIDTDPPPTTSVTDENSKSDQLESVPETEVTIEPTIPTEITNTAQEHQNQENENVEQLSQETVLPTLDSTVIPDQNFSSEGSDPSQNEEEEVASNQLFSEPAEEILNQAPFLSSPVPVELGSTVNLQPSTDTVLQGSSTILDDYYLKETPKTVAMEQQQNFTRIEDQVTPRIPETVLLDTMTSILENQIASSSPEPEGPIVATRVEKSESVVSSIPEEETQVVLSQVEEKTQEPLPDSTAAISAQELNEVAAEDSGNTVPAEEAQTLSPEKVETVQPYKLSDGGEKVENKEESESQDDDETTITIDIETPPGPSQEIVTETPLSTATSEDVGNQVDSTNDIKNETIPEDVELEPKEIDSVTNEEDNNDEKEIVKESSIVSPASIETLETDNVESSSTTASSPSVEKEVEETVTNATPTELEQQEDATASASQNATDTETGTEQQSVLEEQPTNAEQESSVLEQDPTPLEQQAKAAEPAPGAAVVDQEIGIVEEDPANVEQQREAVNPETVIGDQESRVAEQEASTVVPEEAVASSEPSSEDPKEEKPGDLPNDLVTESDSTTEATAVLDEQVDNEPTASTAAVEQVEELNPQEAVTPVPQEPEVPTANATSDNVNVNVTLSESKPSQQAADSHEKETKGDLGDLESSTQTPISEEPPADNLSETKTPNVSVTEDTLPQATIEPEIPVPTILAETEPGPAEIPQPIIEIVNITPPPPIVSPENVDVPLEETKPSENESTADLPTPTSTETPIIEQPIETVAVQEEQMPDLQEPQEEQEKHSNEDTTTDHHDHHDHHHHERHHHRHRHFTKGSWNDSSSSSIIVVIKHLSSTLLSFLPEALQDTILDVDDALVFTGIIALTLVSICVPYFFIEGYMSVRPLKKKVVELNKSLWKVSAAYETQQEEFEIFKRKAIAHDEYRKRAEQSENDVIILKTLEQKHREQIQALRTQLKSQIKEAKDIRALIEKTLQGKKIVEEESANFKAIAEKTSQELAKAKEELASFQTHTKSTVLQLGVSSKNAEVMSSKITMLEQETEHLKSQLVGESEKRKALAEEMNLVNQSKAELEKELAEVKKICVQYEGTVDGLNNDVYKLESELTTIKETLGEDSPLIEIAEVQARAEFSEKEAESLRTRLDCVCADNETLRGKLEETSVALEEIRNERDTITKKLTVLEKYWTEREEEQLKTIENLTQKFDLRDRGRDELIEMIEQKENELKVQYETLESLKEEMEEQSAKHRNEIRALESKGHENWLSLCQAERKAQDARKDAEMLRQRLTAMVKEKERNEAQDECDDDDSDGLSGQFPMVFPAVIPHELVPPPILDMDDEEGPPSYFGLGDFVPPPPLPDDDDDADGEGRRVGEPRRRPPPLGGTRLSPSLSDYTDDDDEDEDNNNILSPIRRREEEGCTDGSSGSGSGSPPIRGGGWINLPGQRGGSAGMRRLPGSSSSRATSSPVQHGVNL